MSDVSQEVIDTFFPEVPSVEDLREFIRIFEDEYPRETWRRSAGVPDVP
jgi:hypothetical protein